MTIGRIPSVEGGIQPTIVDAKGDLIAGVAADSINRLAVGSNDQVLVADSSTSTGLAWKSVATPFAAGKNKIINGDFGIWQRGTSFTGAGQYAADRFFTEADGNGTFAFSRQTFTPGTAPVAGYEGQYFMRLGCTTVGTTTRMDLHQRIEDVRTLAGQTATISFWAKADTTRTLNAWAIQVFGGGGSADVYTGLNSQPFTITSSWQRFSYTFSIPSISGKTIGTNSILYIILRYAPASGSSMDIWGLQLEAGNTATPFQTATGTLQGELAACQRYYFQSIPLANRIFTTGQAYSTTQAYGSFNLPVTMRVTPSVTFSAAGDFDLFNSVGTRLPITALAGGSPNVDSVRLDATVASGLVAGNATVYIDDAAGNASIRVSAEL